MIDVRRLRALRELRSRGTISAAADALSLTPSAVSQQLAALERESGQTLLEPDGRGVRLTPAADVLLSHADELFAQLERLEADLAGLGAGELGTVRIGSFSTGLAGIAAPAARILRERSPGVALKLDDVEAPEAFVRLARGELDVVISMESVHAPGHSDPALLRIELARDPLDAALPAGHPLAGRRAIPLTALASEDFVGPPEGWTCEEVVITGCRAAGFSPAIRHRAAEWATSLAMVGAGLGVALVPRLAALQASSDVAIVPLEGRPPARHLFAACRRGAEQSPAIAAVLAALREAAAAAPGCEPAD